jgi:hypothetical protein
MLGSELTTNRTNLTNQSSVGPFGPPSPDPQTRPIERDSREIGYPTGCRGARPRDAFASHLSQLHFRDQETPRRLSITKEIQ